tara:strand:+ start:6930 stop:8540 length:1611 start_codon:yes stop_codon:yes gene_type:complete
MVAFSGTVQSDYLKFLPTELDNKVKLIDFAAADFSSYREALINYVKATFPLDYNNFESSDFGTLLIELMAAVGHIQSNKADYLANENFLATARSRDSVKRLLELVGVRMKGPISAAANAQIQADTTETVSSMTIPEGDRTFIINSPEDGGSLSYTMYKLNSDGTVDGLGSNSGDITVDVTVAAGTATASSLVIQEGAMVIESGIFRTTDSIKSIELQQSPYIEKSAQVYITGSQDTQGAYTEEDNIYFASGGSDKVFQVTTDENFVASLLFGDNSIGQAPAVGDRYTVVYRVGGGTRGNVAESFINVPVEVTLNETGSTDTFTGIAGTLENTSVATGGRNAETIASAKRYGPLYFRSQDRLVTLEDYKGHANNFASNYGSTGKASATVRRAYSSANIIDLFVLEKASDTQLRRATQEYKKQLLESIEGKKMLTDEVVVVDGLIRTMDLFLVLTIDDNFRTGQNQIIQSARQLTQEYFNVDNTDFGEPFVPEDLVRFILDNEPNIRYARVDNVDSAISVGFNEIIQLNNLNITTSFV